MSMGGRMVSAEDRQAFLMWLGSNHEFKTPAALDILRYFLSSEEALARLRIVEDCSYLRPLIILAAVGQRHPGLLYQTASGSTGDIKTVLMDLQLTQGPVFMAPYFPGRLQAKLYLRVREEGLRPAAEAIGPLLVDLETAQLIASMSLSAKRRELLLLIDQALERRDRTAFTELVLQLKKIPRAKDLAATGKSKPR